MKRCVIFGGAEMADDALIRRSLRPDDFILCCDSGLRHAERLGLQPSLVVGDFDSHAKPDSGDVIVLPREKDDTDTVFAAREAVRRGFDDFLLIGVTGRRFDHTFGNISLLLWLHQLGKRARILDDYSEMEIVSRDPVEIDGRYPYFSLLNISGTARGITIRGAKYPLENAEIRSDYQYGISNEVLPGQTATVSVREGSLLLVRVFAG
ncbi:MAG: thiamine diphosphokinase [Clostridia bacterium]|nr:thiamine diphosphokinase [Clostridia bacterium]